MSGKRYEPERLKYYVAHVWNRHWGAEEKVGVEAYNMEEATKILNSEKGKVLSISAVDSIPRDVSSTLTSWERDYEGL